MAYEMRISDWSSDVCSSDLPTGQMAGPGSGAARPGDLIADPCQAVPRQQVDAQHRASFSQYRLAQMSRPGINQPAFNAVCSDHAFARPHVEVAQGRCGNRLKGLAGKALGEIIPPVREKADIGWQQGRHCNRSEEHTSELQSLMHTSYAVFCLKKKTK